MFHHYQLEWMQDPNPTMAYRAGCLASLLCKARDEMTPADLIRFLKGEHKHPIFYWVWPRMKVMLDSMIEDMADRLKR